MQPYGVNELREMFLKFFESKGHLALKSFSLIPHNDNSLLLINAGMAPLKPYFTGQEVPPARRVVTCQKCIRTGDIENVGKTARHGTFFEMLGNFSFGDYFKKDAIKWSWEFLTEVVGLDPDRLYPSVYVDDSEAFDIWNRDIGIPKERIFKFGKEDNFWEHGSGPCGPCSEIYYDRGEKYGCGKPTCTVGCDCDRYMEIWNNVFTQFDNDGHGNYTELAAKNIDTGMGLERLAMAVQGVDSIFDVDTLRSLRAHVCSLAGVEYGADRDRDVSVRVITDHIRSMTFMISDGIMPSNEGRGYVLRRLIRRACRHGRLLGIRTGFLPGLAVEVIEGSKDGYPELEEKRDFILKVISNEEEQFDRTIDQGLKILSDIIENVEVKILTGIIENPEDKYKKRLSGEDAFRLYDTYGFPLDLTKEILKEKNIGVDEEGFKAAMKVQRDNARAARAVTNYMGADSTVYDSIDLSVTSRFVGYDRLSHESKILALTTDRELAFTLKEGQQGTVIAAETPFYAKSGGQDADTGFIRTADGSEFKVEDTIKLLGGKIGHVGRMVRGMMKIGDEISLEADAERRMLSARNHSATHLLHKALRIVLGTHVEQAGSSVNADRLRFDFTHFSALTKEELAEVERLVNEHIDAAMPVEIQEMPIDKAKATGALALFGEKYGKTVRVVNMGGWSIELCGGTHVKNTGEIMAFRIISETGVASGVRRIEALTSKGLLAYYEKAERDLAEAAKALKVLPAKLSEKIGAVLEENKKLREEADGLRRELAKGSMGDFTEKIVEVSGIKLLAIQTDNADGNALRDLGDQLKEKLGEGVVVLASSCGGKANLMATATEGAIKRGAHAGNLIKAIAAEIGGGGGGRPNMAQAGGKKIEGIKKALLKAKEVLRSQLS